MKICGNEWKALSEAQKAPYFLKHEIDVKRHDKQVKDMKEKGYFLMPDGSKSTDHLIAKKKSAAKSPPEDKKENSDKAEKIVKSKKRTSAEAKMMATTAAQKKAGVKKTEAKMSDD